MTTLFVTSSGTDIGKTHVCCALLESLPPTLRVRCVKPVVTGFDAASADTSDTGRLLQARRHPITTETIDATSPWRYRDPVSADMAAEREARPLPFDELVDFCRKPEGVDLNLVEGIGGVMAPLGAAHTVLDWIAALETEVLLVVGSYLGSLSHTLTALDVLSRRKRRPVAIVVSQSLIEPVPIAETVASLARFSGIVPIIAMGRDASIDPGLVELVARLARS